MMKRSNFLAIFVVAGLATVPARASVWDDAATSAEDTASKDLYDAKMLEGDTATLTATIQAASIKSNMDSIRRAQAAYRAAAQLRPREAEPYFRIGNLLYQMHFDCEVTIRLATCDPMYATSKQAEAVVDAWNEFENRTPLDPRISDLLLKRAILNTKLVNGGPNDRRYLEGAARDYQAALDRSDGMSVAARSDEQLLGNLAETYMMLNRLDESIATYQRALVVGGARVSTTYGLAVALDRDGSGDQAMRRIQSLGIAGYDSFNKDYLRHSLFFVPRGESDYYFALANEALGNYGLALAYWNRFLASGAHPVFQPRAREHIEQLHKRNVRAEPPTAEPEDVNW